MPDGVLVRPARWVLAALALGPSRLALRLLREQVWVLASVLVRVRLAVQHAGMPPVAAWLRELQVWMTLT